MKDKILIALLALLAVSFLVGFVFIDYYGNQKRKVFRQEQLEKLNEMEFPVKVVTKGGDSFIGCTVILKDKANRIEQLYGLEFCGLESGDIIE